MRIGKGISEQRGEPPQALEAAALHGGSQAGELLELGPKGTDGVWPRTEGDVAAEKVVDEAMGDEAKWPSPNDDDPLPPAA